MRSITELRRDLAAGIAIPAHPLALTPERTLDERHQRALTRYYLAAGAGGLAVGVHTTQFAIRNPRVGLLRPVLALAADVARSQARPPVMVAGVCGQTSQAAAEAELAASLGYDAGLVSMAALSQATDAQMVAHCREVARVLPVFGFYLQPAVGGRILSPAFWRSIAEIEQVVAIKIAPFDRYQTIDVVRSVAESGRASDIALYTGNDDTIVADLLSTWRFAGRELHMAGGLLGQWAVGTRRAVELLASVRQWRGEGSIPVAAMSLAQDITDTNAALFDAAHGFAGCIAGIHEVLRQQGLMAGRWCLDPREDLSEGQGDDIGRVMAAYPHLHDTDFVRQHLDEWLA